MNEVNQRLRNFRINRGLSVNGLAKKMGMSGGLVSLVENGREPSLKYLNSFALALGLSSDEAEEIGLFNRNTNAGQTKVDRVVPGMIDGINTEKSVPSKVVVPTDVNIMYSDSIFLTTTDYGFVFDIGQRTGPTNEIKIVSRVGISIEHAKALSKLLNNKLDEKK